MTFEQVTHTRAGVYIGGLCTEKGRQTDNSDNQRADDSRCTGPT